MNDRVFNNRYRFLVVVFIFFFILLFFSFFKVMIIDNKKYSKLVDELSNKVIYGDSAPRGRILDRNYNIIVDNKISHTIIYNKGNSSINEMIDLSYVVSDIIELDYNKVNSRMKKELYYYKNKDLCKKYITDDELLLYEMRKIDRDYLENLMIDRVSDNIINSYSDKDNRSSYLFYLMRNGYSYLDKVIKSNASDEEVALINENLYDGFSIRDGWERFYPYGDTMKSILGSVSSIPYEYKNEYLKLGYSLNDRVGISYLEKEYEEYLVGKKGEYRVVNSNDIELVREGIRGNDIVLSIDINLQVEIEKIIVEEMLRAKKEANTEYYNHSSVVIEDPYSGEVLAMASKKIINGEIVDNANSIFTTSITPGSVVKGASILVGYKEGVIKIGEKFIDECVKISGAPKKCSYKTLGLIDDIVALAKSSNVYQFKTAIRVNGQEYFNGMKLNFKQESFDKYRNMYQSFGLGVLTGIDLPFESRGYSSIDKSSGNLLDFVMGQYETYTPLQLSQYINTISNGGDRYQVHLLKEVRDTNNNVIYSYQNKILNKIDVSEKYMNRMKEGFYAVMHMSGGYGRGYVEDRHNAAGKTGTSQSFIDTNNDGIIDTETITSSFVGYVPSDKPKYSIVVVSPNSSHPNSGYDFASLVTLRITKRVTNKCSELNFS